MKTQNKKRYTELIFRFFKNRNNRECEEHNLLHRVPKHEIGNFKKEIKNLVKMGKLTMRKGRNKVLYRLCIE